MVEKEWEKWIETMTNKKKKGETKEENKRHVGKNTNNPKKI
jgi:hypothetical protein